MLVVCFATERPIWVCFSNMCYSIAMSIDCQQKIEKIYNLNKQFSTNMPSMTYYESIGLPRLYKTPVDVTQPLPEYLISAFTNNALAGMLWDIWHKIANQSTPTLIDNAEQVEKALQRRGCFPLDPIS